MNQPSLQSPLSSPEPNLIPRPGRRLVQDHKSSARWLQIMLDLILVTGLLVVHASYKGVAFDSEYRFAAILTVLLMLGVYHVNNVYQMSTSQFDRSLNLLKSWAIVLALLVLAAWFGALTWRRTLDEAGIERLGWTVFYPGPDVPIAGFSVIQMSHEASLVCISLPPGGTMGDVSRTLDVLGQTYNRARPYAIAFGGPSHVSLEGETREGPFESVSFFQECSSLRRAIEQGLGNRGYQA